MYEPKQYLVCSAQTFQHFCDTTIVSQRTVQLLQVDLCRALAVKLSNTCLFDSNYSDALHEM